MIYLLRHGQTEWNVEHRYQGWRDSALTEHGRAQARAAGRLLAELIDDPSKLSVISSPLTRTKTTARIVLEQLGLATTPVYEDSRLTEMRMGLWEGMLDEEVEAQYGDLLAARRADPWSISPPDGETYTSVSDRVGAWLSEQNEDRKMLVVTHGIAGRILYGLYLGLEREQIQALSPFRQDEIHVLHQGIGQTFETMPE